MGPGSSSSAKHGSFKSAFSGSQPGKNGFRVSFRNPGDGQSHTLFAPDEHSKKSWLSALKKVTNTNEVDSVLNDTGLNSTPQPGKRIYALHGKVMKNSPRVGLFQRNCRKSPRIKASLSHTALESVRSGGAVKKIRSTASAKKLHLLDENELKSSKLVQVVSASTSKLPPPFKLATTPPPTPPPRGLKRDTSQGCLVAAAVGRRIVRNTLNSATSKASPALKNCSRSRLPPPVPPKSGHVRKLAGSRPRNKSWGHLQVLNVTESTKSSFEIKSN